MLQIKPPQGLMQTNEARHKEKCENNMTPGHVEWRRSAAFLPSRTWPWKTLCESVLCKRVSAKMSLPTRLIQSRMKRLQHNILCLTFDKFRALGRHNKPGSKCPFMIQLPIKQFNSSWWTFLSHLAQSLSTSVKHYGKFRWNPHYILIRTLKWNALWKVPL